MGFSIILTLDDAAARSASPAELGTFLRAALGSDSYPSHGLPALDAGPWRRLGSVGSAEQAGILFGRDRAELVFVVSGPVAGIGPGAPDHACDLSAAARLPEMLDARLGGSPAGFTAQLSAADHRAAFDRLSRPSAEMFTALAAGASPAEAAFGPDPFTDPDRVSLWWFFADALASLPAGPDAEAELGAKVLSMLDDRFTDSIAAGSHAAALRRAGVLHGPVPVGLVFSGNRVCLPGMLTEREAAVLALRLARFV